MLTKIILLYEAENYGAKVEMVTRSTSSFMCLCVSAHFSVFQVKTLSNRWALCNRIEMGSENAAGSASDNEVRITQRHDIWSQNTTGWWVSQASPQESLGKWVTTPYACSLLAEAPG